ncbi:MAG TPA: hypothetical protein VIF57_11250, partial [Polyangia bacterium]
MTRASNPPSPRLPPCRSEIAAAGLEVPELVAALPSLLPEGWTCGVDDVTPNTAHLFARPRERCAALEIDVGRGDFSVRDLEGGARELSRRAPARVILWGQRDPIFFVELEAGEAIARLDRVRAGDYRGVDWRSFSAGAVAPPFPADLLALFEARRDAEFVDGLLCWQHGARGARGEPVAQIFRRYRTREPSPALRAVLRAALRRARATGSAMMKGCGRLLSRAGEGGGPVAVRPARSLLRFFDGGAGALALDFSSLASRLGAAAVAQAEDDLAEALTAARDDRGDVVFPGLLCITTRRTPAVTSTNPRDGSTFTIPGHVLPVLI